MAVLASLPSAAATAQAADRLDIGRAAPVPAIQPGFLGLSLEYYALLPYAGSDPRAINPVFLQLIRNLNSGQAPSLRIGGDSTDGTWWPLHVKQPGWVKYSLNGRWLDVAAPTLRFLFWAGLVLLPFVVLMCDYGTQP